MYKVSEIYGPVFQGEGPLTGTQTWFLRMFGCDYACSWCDTRYAWAPEFRGGAREMSTYQIIEELGRSDLPVTISGGNPLLWDLRQVVLALKAKGRAVNIETQGTAFKPWAALCDVVLISPKPPSSGEVYGADQLVRFVHALADELGDVALAECVAWIKFPISDQADLDWAASLWDEFNRTAKAKVSAWAMPVSPRTPNPGDDRIIERWRWLERRVVELNLGWAVSPQLHVLAHGGERGR